MRREEEWFAIHTTTNYCHAFRIADAVDGSDGTDGCTCESVLYNDSGISLQTEFPPSRE